jgi:hypothetical protein
MPPMVWLLVGRNEILQTLLYGDARVVPFPNTSTIVELSYTFKAVTLLLGIIVVPVVIPPIPPPGGGGGTAPPGGGAIPPPGGGAIPPPGGGAIPPPDGGGTAPPGAIAPDGGVVPVFCCACTELPPLLSIPNVRTNVESIATLYRILLLNI